ncbi:muramidase [Xylella taiwanensis]|uniref:Glycoside hydrolase family 25 protein n=1 Tax=Xylella taiwanensis TaxID=1444770 RepID=Z9JH58_9GAMM|nr:glycoside hydrolase family 25 protein [Xylella taiwanensis]AXI83442.1 muramidase [Xylella taiwanensis]EWS77499.1 muramidase [Xylella taiwanensis]MCD8456514.1 glycoside hydrolase family 25 protein [Xylella taiwanensis]MCD8458921.1 glycoside hydrolase family 25 protein [Xylella taiwanensis]MCD8461059.1 glycoside hydrolase family 25 protein [Xylella taiwanensis]
MFKKGIDISHWNGDIDFIKVKGANIDYVFIKATEGATYHDPLYVKNRSGALSAGMKAGTYHYFRALSSTPEAQKDNIVNVLTKNGFNSSHEYLALSVARVGNEEAKPEVIADNLYKLLLLLGKEYIIGDRKPLIYCSKGFWDESVAGDRHNFSEYPLWVANWDVDEPKIPQTWSKAGKTWSVWQYSSKGSIPGINGDVLLDNVRL